MTSGSSICGMHPKILRSMPDGKVDDVSTHTVVIASGRPFSPSCTTMHTSATPRTAAGPYGVSPATVHASETWAGDMPS